MGGQLERAPAGLNERAQRHLLRTDGDQPSVQAGERQQVLAERLHLQHHGARLLDGGPILRRRSLPRSGDLQGGAQARQRRAQLVADVGREPLLAQERLAEPHQELVDLGDHRRDLVGQPLGRQNAVQPRRVEVRDLGGQRPRRAQPPRHHQERDARRRQQRQQGQAEQPPAHQRECLDQLLGPARHDHGHESGRDPRRASVGRRRCFDPQRLPELDAPARPPVGQREVGEDGRGRPRRGGRGRARRATASAPGPARRRARPRSRPDAARRRTRAATRTRTRPRAIRPPPCRRRRRRRRAGDRRTGDRERSQRPRAGRATNR